MYLVRFRLIAVPNDNSKGKSSRYNTPQVPLESCIIRRVIARDLPHRILSYDLRHFTDRTIGVTKPRLLYISCRSACYVSQQSRIVRDLTSRHLPSSE